MHEYLIHINTEENRQEAKKLFRAMDMNLPVKIGDKWHAVKSIQTKKYRHDEAETRAYGFAEHGPRVFVVAITPYHTKRVR